MISEKARSKQAAARLKAAREKHYKSARAASEDNGWTESTYRAHESDGRTYGMDDAIKYGRRFGVNPLYLYHGDLADKIPQPVDMSQTKVQTGTLPVKGEVRAGAWLEVDEQWESDEGTIPVVANPKYNAPQYALKVVGDSMNRVFPEGQYVICASLVEMGRDAQHGELVIVERHRSGLIEVTVKRLDLSGSDPVLRPESTNKAHVPLRIDDQPPDTEIYITGLVVGRFEPF